MMKKWTLRIVVGCVLLVGCRAASAQSNFVGMELLGRGILYSVNYERYVHPRIGVGGGIATWRINNSSPLIIPMYVSANPVGKTHSLYVAAGATIGLTAETLWGGADTRTVSVGTASLGYEFRSPQGLVIRPTTNVLYGLGGYIVWPGVTIGRRF